MLKNRKYSKHIICVVISCGLLIASFLLGGYLYHPNSVVPHFYTHDSDSLDVYRVASIDTWISQDHMLTAQVSYIQLGESGSCCLLRLTKEDDEKDYFGMFCMTDSCLLYSFANPTTQTCIILPDMQETHLYNGQDTIRMIKKNDFEFCP